MRVTGPGNGIPIEALPERAKVGVTQGKGSDGKAAVIVAPGAAAISGRTVENDGVHAARVDKLKLQVESGSYRVDPQRLAERLVDEEIARAPR